MIEEIDNREDYGEERIIVLGGVGLLVLTVIYTKRGETIRIISARKANIDDEQIFYREIYGRGT